MPRTFIQKLSAELDRTSRGIVYLSAEYDLHPDLQSLSIGYPDCLKPDFTDGFSESRRHQCEWDGTTTNPSIRFRYEVDRTNLGGYQFIDRGGWALLSYPPINTSWRYSGHSMDLTREYAVSQEGITSSDGSIVYLGPHEEEQFRSGGHDFRLAIPDQASLRAPLEEIMRSLSFAAENFDVGQKEEKVIIAAPSNINWSYEGIQCGDSGFWVVDSTRVSHANNTWVHEFIHTCQEWERHSSTQWLIEGTTNYYSALLTYLEDRISFSAFHRYLTTDQHRRSVLIDPHQWTSPNAYYTKGRRVMAALDAKIRTATDGEKTFETVFRRINQDDQPLTNQKLKRIVTDVADHDMSRWFSQYIESPQTPDVPEDEALFSGVTTTPHPEPEPEPEPESEPESEPEAEEEPTSEDDVEECPVCRNTVSGDDEFCNSCGTALFRQCPVCGRDVTDDPYCPECGTEIQETCSVCGSRRHPSEEFCATCGTKF